MRRAAAPYHHSTLNAPSSRTNLLKSHTHAYTSNKAAALNTSIPGMLYSLYLCMLALTRQAPNTECIHEVALKASLRQTLQAGQLHRCGSILAGHCPAPRIYSRAGDHLLHQSRSHSGTRQGRCGTSTNMLYELFSMPAVQPLSQQACEVEGNTWEVASTRVEVEPDFEKQAAQCMHARVATKTRPQMSLSDTGHSAALLNDARPRNVERKQHLSCLQSTRSRNLSWNAT